MKHPALPPPEALGHVHLIAVGGTGMAPLAGLFARWGRRVTGSDGPLYPPTKDLLEELEIPVLEGYRPENIPREAELVVVGNVITRENPEAQEALRRGLPVTSMPEALAHYFIGSSHSIVVSGTHGKSFTSSLLAWLLTQAGLEPGFLIGAFPKNFWAGFALGSGRYFVVEGDEYDSAFFDKQPKFLHYRPQTLILTSIEFDHGDIYPSLEAVEEAFRRLVGLLPPSGLLVACTDDERVRALIKEAPCPVETYGLRDPARWKARDISSSKEGTSFCVSGPWRLGPLGWKATGRHNVQNALAAVAACYGLGLEPHQVVSGLESFEGVRRRQEVVGEPGGILMVEDFAHHPTAVRETVGAVGERYRPRRLWALFEPRTNTTRRRTFQEAYAESFFGAQEVIVAKVHRAEAIPPEERFDPDRLVRDLNSRGIRARYLPEVEEIVEVVSKEARPGDLVLVMSNGPFGGLVDKLKGALEERARG
jgi:UDP-N-acetylmuramate: L-alanyl-gamma-D-glutamyl-meso-diaminopimelate ligase